MNDTEYFGWSMTFHWVIMALFWITIIWIIFTYVKLKYGGSFGSTRPQKKKALDILKERFARGEINQEEYQKKKNDLEQ